MTTSRTNRTSFRTGSGISTGVNQGKARLSVGSLDEGEVWRVLQGLEPGRVHIGLRKKEGKKRGSR